MRNNLDMKVRSAPRRRCRLFGQLKYLSKETNARIVNLSMTGIAIDITGPFYGAAGSKVTIESEDIGSLEGTVRWLRGSRIGVEFLKTSNSSAKVASYFRFTHKEITPVLKR